MTEAKQPKTPDLGSPKVKQRVSTSPAKKVAAKKVAAKKVAAKKSGKTTHNGSRREEIVRAAAETFYKKGYDATTTQDIAEAVGMLKGSLYYYITAKEDLLYEIIDGVHEVLTGNLERNRSLDGEALSRIWLFVHTNVVANAEYLITSAVFFRDFGALTGARRKHIVALRDQHDHFLRDLIREGQQAGSVREDVEPKLAATAILTMCNSLYYWYRPGGEFTAEMVATAYADQAVAGLASESSSVGRVRELALAASTEADD